MMTRTIHGASGFFWLREIIITSVLFPCDQENLWYEAKCKRDQGILNMPLFRLLSACCNSAIAMISLQNAPSKISSSSSTMAVKNNYSC